MADSRSRSRFDRDPPRRSGFDRRSRSPPSRQSDSRRTRSPIARDSADRGSSSEPTKKPVTPAAAAAAAAAAAKIAAQIQAKKAIQPVDVAPIRSQSVSTPPTVKSPDSKGGRASGDIYQQDGDFKKDIEINDLRNRYTLTKGAVQKTIKDETGADVTTRGEYYPDKRMATAAKPPLFLHITATSKESLEKAVEKIEQMMQEELPNLIDERRFRRREPEVERDEYGRRKWPEERLPIDLEPISGFNLRAQVVGSGGANVKYIQSETGCKVQIKGRGSGFIDSQTGQESDEPMYLHIAGPRPEGVQQARTLCVELLENVKQSYNEFKERPPQHRYGGAGGGGGDGYSNGGGYGDRGRRDRGDRHTSNDYTGGYNSGYGNSYGNGYGNAYGSQGQTSDVQSPTTNAPAAGLDEQQKQWAAYYEQYGQQYGQQAVPQAGEDPYAAYGGYDAYMRWYNEQYAAYYYGQAGGAQPGPDVSGASNPSAPPGMYASATPPSATQGYAQPPPPPATGPPGTSYNSVPPPPGL